MVANVYSQTEYWNVVWEQNGKLLNSGGVSCGQLVLSIGCAQPSSTLVGRTLHSQLYIYIHTMWPMNEANSVGEVFQIVCLFPFLRR